MGPGDDASGIVELYSISYGWSTICINKWSDEEARLVCQEVGYDSGDSTTSRFVALCIVLITYKRRLCLHFIDYQLFSINQSI